MRWEDEPYVRLYKRETPDFAALSWQARALFHELLKRVDMAGILMVGKSGLRGMAGLVRMPIEVVRDALHGEDGLLADGCVVEIEGGYVMPGYVNAQTAKQSDKLRKAEQRARDRSTALAASRGVTDGHAESQPVTKRDIESRSVTKCHAESPAVTRGHSDLSRADLSREEPPFGGHAREGAGTREGAPAHAHESPPAEGGAVDDHDADLADPNDERHPGAATPAGRRGASDPPDADVDVGGEPARPEADSVAARPVSRGTHPGPSKGRSDRARPPPDPATAAVLALLEERRETRGIAKVEVASRLAAYCREHGHAGKSSLADVLTWIGQAADRVGDREATEGGALTQREVSDTVFGFVKKGPTFRARASPGRGGAAIRQQGAAHEYPVEVLDDDDDDGVLR